MKKYKLQSNNLQSNAEEVEVLASHWEPWFKIQAAVMEGLKRACALTEVRK